MRRHADCHAAGSRGHPARRTWQPVSGRDWLSKSPILIFWAT